MSDAFGKSVLKPAVHCKHPSIGNRSVLICRYGNRCRQFTHAQEARRAGRGFEKAGGVFLDSPHRLGRINLFAAIRTDEVFERGHRIFFALEIPSPVTFHASNCGTAAGWTGGNRKFFYLLTFHHSAKPKSKSDLLILPRLAG